ncbi:MAG: ABC transporter ATP-binding protein, partial [Niameybacter sp.]
ILKTEVYIFDDSFSALDFKTDSNLRKALKSEITESAMILVAQRISTIMDADEILVLYDGNVVGQGTHRELLDNCEVYKEIALSQLSKEEIENGK